MLYPGHFKEIKQKALLKTPNYTKIIWQRKSPRKKALLNKHQNAAQAAQDGSFSAKSAGYTGKTKKNAQCIQKKNKLFPTQNQILMKQKEKKALAYSHRQTGYSVMALMIIPVLIILLISFYHSFDWPALFAMLLIAFALSISGTMQVKIENNALLLKMGIGIIKRKFPLEEIIECSKVKNPWYYGWGVRLTPHGLLYNVSGFDAVKIKMKSGKQYRIGTDQPEKLEQAIKQQIKQR